MEKVLYEMRHAFRQFHESLGFSVTAVVMLALGIAATTATFSVVEGVLLRPLPFQDPGRLVALGDILEGTGRGNGGGATVTAPEIGMCVCETRTPFRASAATSRSSTNSRAQVIPRWSMLHALAPGSSPPSG